MSGRKYSVVHERSGWDARSYAERQADNARRNAQRHAEGLAHEISDEIAARARSFDMKVKNLRREQQEILANVNNQMDRMGKNLDASMKRLGTKMEKGIADVRTDIAVAMQLQEESLRQAIREQGNILDARLKTLEKTARDTEHFARDVVCAVLMECQYIRDTYMYDMFCPGDIDAIMQRISAAEENLAAGRGASALPLAQESLLEIQRLHLRLEVLQQQWEMKRLGACAALDTALDAVRDNQEFTLAISVITPEKETPMPNLPMDYWSEGALSKLQEDLLRRKSLVADLQSPASLQELEESLVAGERSLEELPKIARYAHENALASIRRANMQMDFYEKLSDSGYLLVDNVWEGEDERRANHMVLKGINGDLVAIAIEPSAAGEQSIDNRIEINFKEPAPSEIRRREKLNQLTQVLSSVYDIPAAFTPMPGEEWTRNAPDECFDLQRVRERGRNKS